MMKTFAIAALMISISATAHTQQPQRYYEEDVSSSNPGRAEQAGELDRYIKQQAGDRNRIDKVFHPDYRSESAYVASTKPLRKALTDSIGYPPPGNPDKEAPSFTRVGEDELAVYHRVKVSILPGVHAIGLFIVPKAAKGRVPLIISMHGGGGSPEVALFHGGSNYHDMVRGAAKNGYAVWAPQHLFRAEGYPGDIRNQIDTRARMVGTTITAIEIAKITRSLDVILKRPEVDPKRVGMVGLSYGGFYAIITAALEPRIKVTVSSCYYGCQDWRYERNELGVPSDFQFMNAFTTLRDPELTALICPRALEIQAGTNDAPSHRDGGRKLSPLTAEYYTKVGHPERFRFVEFNGGHEFWDETAWEWVAKHL